MPLNSLDCARRCRISAAVRLNSAYFVHVDDVTKNNLCYLLSTANTASYVDKVAVGDPEAAQSSSPQPRGFDEFLFCLIMSHDSCRSRR